MYGPSCPVRAELSTGQVVQESFTMITLNFLEIFDSMNNSNDIDII